MGDLEPIESDNQLFTPTQEDWNLIDEMLQAHCDGTEIAGEFGISQRTLKRHIEKRYGVKFVKYKAQKRGKGRAKLKLFQFRNAQTNPLMAIFLGKQYLGQSDKPKEETPPPSTQPITIVINEVKRND